MTDDKAEEALAESWASIDGKIDKFVRCKEAETPEEEFNLGGHYSGYMADAKEMIRRLRKRGYGVIPVLHVDSPSKRDGSDSTNPVPDLEDLLEQSRQRLRKMFPKEFPERRKARWWDRTMDTLRRWW